MILFRQSVPFRTWLRGLKSSAVPRKGEGNGDPMSRKFIFKYDDQEEVVMHSIRRVFCQLWLRHADTREVFKFGWNIDIGESNQFGKKLPYSLYKEIWKEFFFLEKLMSHLLRVDRCYVYLFVMKLYNIK